MIHGSGNQFNNALSGIQGAAADSRALTTGFFPLLNGSHLAEPEGVSAALERPDRIDPAAIVIEPAAAVTILNYAETRCNRPQMNPDQIGCGHLQKIRKNPDFFLADADEAGVSRAAGAAAPAFKANAVIKKIPAMIVIARVAFHAGFDL